jgi:hypothetical protein
MSNLKMMVDKLIEDVNREDGYTLTLFEKITISMFFLIKWAGIPFVIYLLFEVSRW